MLLELNWLLVFAVITLVGLAPACLYAADVILEHMHYGASIENVSYLDETGSGKLLESRPGDWRVAALVVLSALLFLSSAAWLVVSTRPVPLTGSAHPGVSTQTGNEEQ